MPGGSGYLGRNLRDRLVARGDSVIVLTRGAPDSGPGWESVRWDPAALGQWVSVLDGADAIVHLSGKRVDCRPTKRNLAELISSRVGPVRTVGRAWSQIAMPPPVWVQLSSLARYGDAGETIIDEDTVPFADGPPQMVQVCTEWEAAFASVSQQVPRSWCYVPVSDLVGPVIRRPSDSCGWRAWGLVAGSHRASSGCLGYQWRTSWRC